MQYSQSIYGLRYATQAKIPSLIHHLQNNTVNSE